MLTSLSFVFLLGLAMAALLQGLRYPISPCWHVGHRYFTGALCIKLAFRVDPGDLFGIAADGIDHHTVKSGIVPEFGRSKESRQTGSYDVLCSCQF